MLTKEIDVHRIIQTNPQINADSVGRIDLLMKRLDRLGIKATGYRLASPFYRMPRAAHQKCRLCHHTVEQTR